MENITHEYPSAVRPRGRSSQGRRSKPLLVALCYPDLRKEKPNQGEVVAVGDGKVLDNGEQRPLAVKVGDTVVFGQYAGSNTIEIDGEELILMGESEIYAVVE